MKNSIAILTFFLLLMSCSNNNSTDTNMTSSLGKINQGKLNSLSKKNILFGHQSVGFNIIDGIKLHVKNLNLNLNVEEISNFEKLLDSTQQSTIFHYKNGKNKFPESKINSFYEAIKNTEVTNNVNFAGFKFCYVDFNENTDINKVFNTYVKTIDSLNNDYPNLKIIHFTAPLRSVSGGIKGLLKKMLGKKSGIEDNYIRQKFNNLLLKEYDNQYIFDLAKIQSTYPNGKREFSVYKKEKIYSLIPSYTNDGGHLSSKGESIVSEKFLLFLLNI